MTPNFTGMNPYLENPALWSEIHSWLIIELARYLNPSLIPKYRAAVEKWVYLDALLVGIPGHKTKNIVIELIGPITVNMK
jgi:hypothetical protein